LELAIKSAQEDFLHPLKDSIDLLLSPSTAVWSLFQNYCPDSFFLHDEMSQIPVLSLCHVSSVYRSLRRRGKPSAQTRRCRKIFLWKKTKCKRRKVTKDLVLLLPDLYYQKITWDEIFRKGGLLYGSSVLRYWKKLPVLELFLSSAPCYV